MTIIRNKSLSVLLALFVSLLLQNSVLASKKPYVVFLGEHAHSSKADASLDDYQRATESHYDLLGSVLGDKQKAQDAIFYSYTYHINGFSAILDEEEAAKIERYPGVVSVFPSRSHKLHTTRSWQFLGLETNSGTVLTDSLWKQARYGEDTIIGNLDSGVWPESPSFSDEGLGPIPSRWRGICQKDVDKTFPCNRKLIGARYFNKGYKARIGGGNKTLDTPRDTDGHGTHTLSTAGGAFVPDVSVFGYGYGTAKGGSPRARVAAYKVCYPPVGDPVVCTDSDILAGFDAAIHDGVDVLSVSLGGSPRDYMKDGTSIGALLAVNKGIVVVCSAGNDGPSPGTVTNSVPWIFTVGASTMDREFASYVLFNHTKLTGQSLSNSRLSAKQLYPMINAAYAGFNTSTTHSQFCLVGSLDPTKVNGMIVVCLQGENDRTEKGEAVLRAGGAGMVLANDEGSGNDIIADEHVLPATHISFSDGLILFNYLNSAKSPLGYITKPKTAFPTKPAPFMAIFSSQGPNTIIPEILKPDITAPGVSIIAAYSMAVAPTNEAFDKRRIPFKSDSGTSMSCPHIAGVAGLLKTLYPHWSPAAIRSAMMTTAITRDNKREAILNASFVEATPFSYGAGHVWPNRAADPGLIYDLTSAYYLCFFGYNASSTIATTSNGKPNKCPSPEIENLNYPSITIPNLLSAHTVSRTVTNVGSPGTYKAHVKAPKGTRVTVKPKTLAFTHVGEKRKFTVTFELKDGKLLKDYAFGTLRWTDGIHFVRSPLVVNSNTALSG